MSPFLIEKTYLGDTAIANNWDLLNCYDYSYSVAFDEVY